MAQQAERRRRTAAAILDAAEKSYAAAGGYAAVTIEQIAREADVALATIYDHFGGKQDVYLAAADRIVSRNEEYLEAATSETSLSGLQEVVEIGRTYARFHLDHPAAFRLIGLADLDTAAERVSETRRSIDRRLKRMLGRLAAALQRAIDEGDLRPLDAHRVAVVMWATSNGLLAMHARGSLSRRELARALETAHDLQLAGISRAAS